MKVIPSIDLLDGKVVRLYQGRFDDVTVYDDDPIEMAKRLIQMGAGRIHIVDLDAARGRKINNRDIIKKMAKSSEINVALQVGGGVNSVEAAEELLSAGAQYIVVGSLLFRDYDAFMRLVGLYGERIILALDTKDGLIRKDGWQNETGVSVADVMKYDWVKNLYAIMVTDINVDGSLKGPNVELMRQFKEKYPLKWIASGGVNTYEDLIELNRIDVYGTIVGKAIYEGLITNLKDIEVRL